LISLEGLDSKAIDVVVFEGERCSSTQSNNQLMTLKTEQPQIYSCQQLKFSNKPKSYQLTRIYCQLKCIANNHKLPTTIYVPEENFSLAGPVSTKKELVSTNTPSQEKI
jgi:hypothetical protein